MKHLAVRLVDAILIFCLVYGHWRGIESAETFAIIVIGSMVVMAALGCFVMTEALALALAGKSPFRKGFSYVVCACYVAAMVVAEHPQWAAAYFIVFSWLYISAHAKLKTEVRP